MVACGCLHRPEAAARRDRLQLLRAALQPEVRGDPRHLGRQVGLEVLEVHEQHAAWLRGRRLPPAAVPLPDAARLHLAVEEERRELIPAAAPVGESLIAVSTLAATWEAVKYATQKPATANAESSETTPLTRVQTHPQMRDP